MPRLDKFLTKTHSALSRSQIQELIERGHVSVNGAILRKASAKITGDELIEITATENYVSRAAFKLKHAIEHFGLSPKGKPALDIGASTGGFTEVLLENGAAHVFAIDVGHGQLHQKLRDDPRVDNFEGINARYPDADFPKAFEWIVADISFISLAKALGAVLGFAQEGTQLIALIKPQFEVGPEYVGKGGIVKDETARQKACADIRAFLEDAGWSVQGLIESPITGGDGNIEYLIAAKKSKPAS